MKLIYFSSTWCGPCRTLGPIMESVHNSGTPVQKIDVDDNVPLAKQYGVRNIPTVLLVNNQGEKLDMWVGVHSADVYINGYKKHK